MDPKAQALTGRSLQQPTQPLTGMGDHTAAPNQLPSPGTTAARTHPGAHGSSPSSVTPGTARY